jgi:hypothetical protein
MLKQYRDGGGKGPAHGGFKVCFAETEEEGRRTAHRLWPNEGLPGELAQILPTPRHFEQASELVTEEMIGESMPCGPDPEPYLEQFKAFEEAGYDEVYVGQIGPDQDGFLRFFERELRPHLG